MCGIAAIFAREKTYRIEDLQAAVKTLHGRGPDCAHVWSDSEKTIGLAHSRLSVIDLVSGNQPLHSKDGDLHAVVNGEFYDFEKQRKEFEAQGYEFQTKGDSEILLPLYLKYGAEAVHRLRGEFAFVLWDERNRTLIAGRDRFGIKPLFYAEYAGKLYLASEVKALFAAGVCAAWDEESVFKQMFFYPDLDRTLFAGIKQLPPGCLLIATRGGIKIKKYWDLDFPEKSQNEGKFDEIEIVSELRSLIEDSVRLRLRADVEVAAFLSGGVDSSAILGIAAKNSIRKMRAFTIGFEEDGFDETEIARETAESVGAEFNRVKVGFGEIADKLQKAVIQAETLGVNWHGVARFILAEKVSKSGIRVALTGEGADEIFAGYLQFKQDFYAKDESFETTKDETFGLVKEVLGFVPAWMKRLAVGRAPLELLITKDFRRKFEKHNVFESFLADISVRNQLEKRSFLRQSQYLWTRSILPNYTLFAERLEAGNSIETRVPFLDHHVFEFARKIPDELLIKDSQEKYILREAVKPFLTETVYKRAKHPFLAPPALSNPKNPLYELVNDMIRGEAAAKVPFLDQKTAISLIERLPKLPQSAQVSIDSALTMMVCACFLQEEFPNWNKIANKMAA